MNQTKNNNGDAARAENKRERRRVASGRAAVLRRAPSDSDCSGETASLSADSGDRVVRPAPPPPRAAKSRRLHISVNSRRRGSEWEVLEGLKDGQRFEKRPDVFNGYLHKKRKWPLKGWHKRFFVVDGGILVYARSPADVARGRLHGSVDVGLSVISAKTRRRRIDIDADEFIYHLRAKTPDLFRTWLNVLKAHRLYRQHLLTFGARESVPKIHAPSDDLPATDTSSHTSPEITIANESQSPYLSSPFKYNPSFYSNKIENVIFEWQRECNSKGSVIPMAENLGEQMFDLKFNHAIKNLSLCSMHCVEMMKGLQRKKQAILSLNSADVEKQINCTDLERNSLKSNNPDSTFVYQVSLASNKNISPNTAKVCNIKHRANIPSLNSRNVSRKDDKELKQKSLTQNNNATAYYFFTRKKRSHHSNNVSLMRNSRKCTNLVKYRNLSTEPAMKNPPSRCMLQRKYQLKDPEQAISLKTLNDDFKCDVVLKAEAQVVKQNRAIQNAMTSIEYSRITDKLISSIFLNHGKDDFKAAIDKVVKDLYDVRIDQVTPVRALFKCLLEYWLRNTSVTKFKEAMISEKAVERQSNKHFTKDENLSSYLVKMADKETQVTDKFVVHKRLKNASKQISRGTKCYKCQSLKRDTESFERERRVQQLERILKSTVYVCETQCSNQCREKDIKITKKLIDNLEKVSNKSEKDIAKRTALDNSVSSTELPDIQDTINHLISDTAIPPDFAKEFLGAYLDVLLNDDMTESSRTSSILVPCTDSPKCNVQTESVVKKVSKSITTLPSEKIGDIKDDVRENHLEQTCLKDVLDKITTIFSKIKRIDTDRPHKDAVNPKRVEGTDNAINDDLKQIKNLNSNKNAVLENTREKSLVIDLENYSLEHFSMFSDPLIKGVMSISIKVKEKSPSGESKKTQLNMQLADEVKPIFTPEDNSDNWITFISEDSRSYFNKLPRSIKHSFVPCDVNDQLINLKPYLSNSGATSRACRSRSKSDYSEDTSLKSSISLKDITGENKLEDSQLCYRNAAMVTTFLSKNKVQLREMENMVKSSKAKPSSMRSSQLIKPPPTKLASNTPNTQTSPSPKRSESYQLLAGSTSPEQLSVFQKPAPRIIDEKFILLLLENLMILSKSVPLLYKDISSLYLKLRKKHEKSIKTGNPIQGLSLLGRIYNEPTVSGCTNKTTQIDLDMNLASMNYRNKSCNTITQINVDKNVATVSTENYSKHTRTQTEEDVILKLQRLTHDLETEELKAFESAIERTAETKTLKTNNIDHTMFIPSCDNVANDCDTYIKYITRKGNMHNLKWSKARPIAVLQEEEEKRLRQELIKKISLLITPLKVTTPSQTENREINVIEKEPFDVFELFCSQKFPLKKCSSLNLANQDSNSDMKSLYRCPSEPSYDSGYGPNILNL